ncbi:MAG: tautomerase family protein [Candidatus Lokiarchaeota archaeon]|nr:tautomerase family protein [Candidatus Lokiarchaeota archaeon]
MPNITIDGPKLNDLDLKRTVIKEITDSIEKAYNIPRDHIVVIFRAQSPEDVGIAGKLLLDMKSQKP